jgi:UDP-N-acetylmuramate dehydrogenase
VTVRAHVPMSRYTTLKLGGPAQRFVDAATGPAIVAAVRAADQRGDPLLVLGGGSNLVVADAGFPGTVVRISNQGLDVTTDVAVTPAGAGGARASADGDTVMVTVAAGENWDTVAAWSADEGLAGLECLAGIPGLAGATPIQNVGAYGQEVAETITTVRVYDRTRGKTTELANADCAFGYRTSAFKRELHQGSAVTGRFVVLAVTFALQRSRVSEPVRYRELAGVLGIAEGERAPLADVRAAVLELRRGKGMVLDDNDPDTRSAGSFFTNPVLDPAQFARLAQSAAALLGPGVAIPRFPAQAGCVKVPAAWLIENAGFTKGYQRARSAAGAGARISAKHTLALVNPGGATAASLIELAREIRDAVRKRFGVELTPEPVLVGLSL